MKRYFVSANISSQRITENHAAFRPKISLYYGQTQVSRYLLYLNGDHTIVSGGTLSADGYGADYGVG